MNSLVKYSTLIKNNNWRRQHSENTLSHLRIKSNSELIALERLREQIVLLNQLSQVGKLNDVVIDRQKLFTWLRKSAVEKHRAQDTRLEISKQEERYMQSVELVDKQREINLKLERKHNKYIKLFAKDKKKRLTLQLNIDESEVEDIYSWMK